jgi:hypothetical protein
MRAKEHRDDAPATPGCETHGERAGERTERIRATPPGPHEPVRSREKPLLMVDIDGVISLFGFAGPTPWAGHALTPDVAFHAIDGIPHFLSHAAARHLRDLVSDFDLVWASGWEEKAEEHLPRLLGLPAGLPFLRFERSPGRTHPHWKLAAIEEHAGQRALAWIDDAFNDACHAWAGARPAPTLLVQTAPERGLTSVEARLLTEWAKTLLRGRRADVPAAP